MSDTASRSGFGPGSYAVWPGRAAGPDTAYETQNHQTAISQHQNIAMTSSRDAAIAKPGTAAAQAQPNIALIKYWGKRDAVLNLPLVGSLSVTLQSLWTRTLVRFDTVRRTDEITFNGSLITPDSPMAQRTVAGLDLLRAQAGVNWHAEVQSENNFPTAAGLASSASGFAALVVAAASALQLPLDATTSSRLARRCSGSAARSIFGGFVEWRHGDRSDGEDSVAHPLLAADQWPLNVAIAITTTGAKAVSSRAGMGHTRQTSPYLTAWIETQEADLAQAREAIETRDFEALADVSEHNCLKMHAMIMASRPGLIYWNDTTLACLQCVRALRSAGVPVFFTIDAGPQLKAICLPQALGTVVSALQAVPGVQTVLTSQLGAGARRIAAAVGTVALP